MIEIFYIIAFTVMSSLLFSPSVQENVRDILYFFCMVIVIYQITDKEGADQIYHYCLTKRSAVLVTVCMTYILTFISMFFATSYENDGALKGFMYNSHSVASTMILILVILLAVCGERKNRAFDFLLAAIAFLFILLTRARNYLIPAFCIAVCYYSLLQIPLKYKKLVAAIGIIVCVWVLLNSPMGEKFAESAANPYARNKLAAITNFRSVLWSFDIQVFLNSDWMLKLFGRGFSFVKEIHEKGLGTRLWSHNDFLYILIGMGLTGIINYCYLIKKIIFDALNKKVSRRYRILLSVFVLGSAFMNGFFIYSALVLSLLIFVPCMNHLYTEN